MAIFINDMHMPESCDECPFSRHDVHKRWGQKTYCWLKLIDTTDLITIRHDQCPLMEVKGEIK